MKNRCNMQKYFQNIIKSIQKLISFPSVYDERTIRLDGAPFGKANADCLDEFLSLASSMGFATKNYDGYAGEVVFGEGEPFAILAHLDVVPAGDGWRYPPFGGVIDNGNLYGRGTMDDKGPAVICLYALKALKDEGVIPQRQFKLIVGCNEETGWRCMEHYQKVALLPEEGFTPDADFPVIYAEKGILHLRLHFPLPSAPFTTFSGGTASNMVCDHAQAKLKFPLPMPENNGVLDGDVTTFESPVAGVTLALENGILTARGVSAHGSQPSRGANAFQALLAYFARQDEACKRIYNLLFQDGFGFGNMQDETGRLTTSPNVVNYQDSELLLTVDFRIPATHEASEVTDKITAMGVKYEVLHEQKPLFNEKDGKLIQTLSTVYQRVTGKESSPIAIGGGTYARVLKRGCAFGPQEDDEEVTIHQPNEYISLAKIARLAEIYYAALKEIAKG